MQRELQRIRIFSVTLYFFRKRKAFRRATNLGVFQNYRTTSQSSMVPVSDEKLTPI